MKYCRSMLNEKFEKWPLKIALHGLIQESSLAFIVNSYALKSTQFLTRIAITIFITICLCWRGAWLFYVATQNKKLESPNWRSLNLLWFRFVVGIIFKNTGWRQHKRFHVQDTLLDFFLLPRNNHQCWREESLKDILKLNIFRLKIM